MVWTYNEDFDQTQSVNRIEKSLLTFGTAFFFFGLLFGELLEMLFDGTLSCFTRAFGMFIFVR